MPDFVVSSAHAVGTAIYELIVKDRLPVKKVIVASSQAVYGEGQYQCPSTVSCFQNRAHSSNSYRATGRLVALQKQAQSCLLQEGTAILITSMQFKVSRRKDSAGAGLAADPYCRTVTNPGSRQSLYNNIWESAGFSSANQGGLPLVIYEDGRQTRDFVHVQDVIDANMLVLEQDAANFQAFNVGSGNAMSVVAYAHAVLNKLSCDVPLQISSEYRRGDNRHSVSSIAKLSRLGWKPRRTLSTILDDFLEWVDSIGGIPQQLTDASPICGTRVSWSLPLSDFAPFRAARLSV
jgi:dTDP-L-rhamnose 4-epimerase